MRETLINIGHGALSIILLTLPIIIQQHASWENVTIGGLLLALQSFLSRKQAVVSAGRKSIY